MSPCWIFAVADSEAGEKSKGPVKEHPGQVGKVSGGLCLNPLRVSGDAKLSAIRAKRLYQRIVDEIRNFFTSPFIWADGLNESCSGLASPLVDSLLGDAVAERNIGR